MQQNDEKEPLRFPKETMLELVQLDSGEIVLRPSAVEGESEQKEDPLVKIEFSQQVKDMLGDDLQGIGQHMIHSAIQLLMHQQIASWHAKVIDEEPTRYS